MQLLLFLLLFSVFHSLFDGCWYLLCQGLGYFSQPMSLNVLPDVTQVRI